MQALILGRRRKGKSTLAFSLAGSVRKRIIVFDTNFQFRAIQPCKNWAEFSSKIDDGDWVVTIKPDPEDVVNHFTVMTNILWPRDRIRPIIYDTAIICDETSSLQSPNWICSSLERWIRQSPADISIIHTTHRLVDTNRLVRSLLTDLFIFETISYHDLNILENEFESPDLADAVSKLKNHECAHWWIGDAGEKCWSVWREPSLWYVDVTSDRGFYG